MSSNEISGKDASPTTDGVSRKEGEDVRGASLVEYALLVALIAVITITALRVLGRTVSSQYSVASQALSG
jgi:Flp pilus assembly pilin Flp